MVIRAVCLLLLAFTLGALPAEAQLCIESNGTFRFLNNEFPSLSTNGPVFVGQLVVANADGPVSFSIALGGGNDPLPEGLTLDAESGLITGLATQSGNYQVEFVADDGTTQISQQVTFSVSSSGGGGNGGSGLVDPNFPDGRVGVPYTYTLPASPAADGPLVFGASDLPPGLTMNGATGVVSGTPSAAGTFFMSLTVHDFPGGEENIGASIVPVTIHPADASEPPDYFFEFVTRFLNNGEVGTSYCDQYLTQGGAGTVTFGASGLPTGLAVDPATGAVTGTPEVPGTFLVTLTANDGTATITTNLSLVIAPNSTSDFHWNFLGMPAALMGMVYDRQPPIVLTAEGAADPITYSAVGLPAGLTYNSTSGELSGTPALQGEYPVTFTATDGTETITLDVTFIVLPPTGGDVSQIVVNFWVSKAALKLGTDGNEAWRVSAIYNGDRRTGSRFDPATDVFRAQVGSHTLELPAGSCLGKIPDQSCAFKSASGVLPVAKAKINADKQTLVWSTGDDTITETVPGVLAQTVTLGDHAWRVRMSFDANGVFRPALDFERPAFVVAKGTLSTGVPDSDSAKLSLLLADPSFAYEAGVSTLRARILDGTTVLVDREFTALGDIPKTGVDSRTGEPWTTFKTLKDTALTDRVAFSYASAKGKMKLVLTNLDLGDVPADEAHLTVEVTIGSHVYTTLVTFFETKPGKYGLPIP